jgi:hypothetical protein
MEKRKRQRKNKGKSVTASIASIKYYIEWGVKLY